MLKISDHVINLITKSMENWVVELTGRQTKAVIKIQRGIFLEGSLSPLLFVRAMMTFNYLLRKMHSGLQIYKVIGRDKSTNEYG